MSGIIETKHISKFFGGVKAVQNCSIQIREGVITAIIGPNGSGKTTLFNTLTKLYEPTKGKIYLNGKDVTVLPDYEISKKGVSRTFQEVRLFQNLTIADHLAIALETGNDFSWSALVAKVYNPRHKIKMLLKKVGLHKSPKTFAADLSYGQRKLLDLAIALAKPHDVLLLDEPVAGVNPKLRQEIKKILKNLRKEGETIVLIEHDMNFVMDLADDIIVLDTGRVIATGKPKSIQKNKQVLEAYLGVSK
jgi:branched-chain amino acid transport system ATP-binding protein